VVHTRPYKQVCAQFSEQYGTIFRLTIRITLLLGGPSACGPKKPTPARRPPPQAHPARRPLGSASTVSNEWVPVRQVRSVSLAHVLLTQSLETRENRLPNATATTSPFCLPSLPSSPSFRVCRRRRPIRGRCHQQQPWRCCPRPRLTQVRALLVCLLSFLSDHPLCDHLVTVVSAFASSLTVPISRDHEDLHLAASSTCSSSPPTALTTCLTTPHVLACDACAPSTPRYQVSLPRSSGTSTRSPARQSYLLLLASAARHVVRLGRLASSASILAVAGPPIPFIIPSHLLLSPAAPAATIETLGT
jgi:hypothetical protein